MDSLRPPRPATLTIGVLPRGAQVRALAGLSVMADSSAKQIHAPSLRATLLPLAIDTAASARCLVRRVRRHGRWLLRGEPGPMQYLPGGGDPHRDVEHPADQHADPCQ